MFSFYIIFWWLVNNSFFDYIYCPVFTLIMKQLFRPFQLSGILPFSCFYQQNRECRGKTTKTTTSQHQKPISQFETTLILLLLPHLTARDPPTHCWTIDHNGILTRCLTRLSEMSSRRMVVASTSLTAMVGWTYYECIGWTYMALLYFNKNNTFWFIYHL